MYAYSTDEECYSSDDYLTPEAAAADAFYSYPDQLEVWVGEVVKPKTVDLITLWRLEDDIAEEAWEKASEFAEPWIERVQALVRTCAPELEKLIADWIEEREPIDFFTVTNVRVFKRDEMIANGTLEP